jgi:hypothetical protein
MDWKRILVVLATAGIVIGVGVISGAFGVEASHSGSTLVYRLHAREARLNREILGEVTNEVQGVPAEPVHSFVWDGEGSVRLDRAKASLLIDPEANTGRIYVTWEDRNGKWTLTQDMFTPPDHPSGLQVGPSAEDRVLIQDDPVTVDVYLHGDTTAGEPVLPTLFNNMATWGPAEVRLNGELFENPFDGPTPLWVAHTMVTVGARNEDGEVLSMDGGFYNPMEPGRGAVDYGDMEFHVVFHDLPGPEVTENFPPPLDFFYHLTFEDVNLEIQAVD